MIGLVIVTHGGLAVEFRNGCEIVFKSQYRVVCIPGFVRRFRQHQIHFRHCIAVFDHVSENPCGFEVIAFFRKDFSQDELSFSIFKGSLLNQPEIREVQRAHKLFYIGARNHRWIPLIRRIVKLRLGPFYHMVFFLTYFIRFSRESRFNLWNVIKAGWKNLRNY